jgi:hypothetical protein
MAEITMSPRSIAPTAPANGCDIVENIRQSFPSPAEKPRAPARRISLTAFP